MDRLDESGARHDDRPLLPVEDAQARVLAAVEPLAPVRLPVGDAWGCVTAADVTAPLNLPPFASSAMDGYAVRAADVAGATADAPTVLRVAGEVLMGRPAEGLLGPGEAVAVPTGAQVPPGADAVVPIEATEREGDVVQILAPVESGRHVRPAAEDLRAGDVLVPEGRRILAPELGLLASAGLTEVEVRPAARVAILSTGDELVPPGTALGPGQIHDSNASTLEGAVREAGGIPVTIPAVGDDPGEVIAALSSVAGEVDLFVSSGGVAMGERDPVKRAFEPGGEIDFYEVAMQPGKPQAFGRWAGKPFFGLPGNPVSVFVSFEVFVRPALLTMMGRPPFRPSVEATMEHGIEGLPNKTRFARVALRREAGRLVASPTGGHGSNLLGTLSRADGLAVVPPGEGIEGGSVVRVLAFRDLP